ncbi:hypothetical protein [Endozoicomonas sp. ALD040]|uniref:hypothetical protein n=1 Tax=unclassified Endozoicomonas TaxID=2644528 RepID=UPI003BB17E37
MRKQWKGTPESRGHEARLRWIRKAGGKIDKNKAVMKMLKKSIRKWNTKRTKKQPHK